MTEFNTLLLSDPKTASVDSCIGSGFRMLSSDWLIMSDAIMSGFLRCTDLTIWINPEIRVCTYPKLSPHFDGAPP